ncbi:iron ABC transporter permease [Candidatus Bathyarchaeota archaeon]|nr:iron ABC transporter permease [Candidatus Bathyarchaeota archaeon]
MKLFNLNKLHHELDSLTFLQVCIGTIFLSIFLIAPLLLMTGQAFISKNGINLTWFTDLLGSPEYVSFQSRGGRFGEVYNGILYLWGFDYGILLNSLIVAAIVTLICSIIGVLVAFFVNRYNFFGKRIFQILLLVPLLATPFVNAYVIGKLFNPRGGLINYIFYDFLHILPWRIDIDGLFGIILAQVLSYYPIVYLNVSAALNNIDPSLEEMAENLGAKSLKLFRTITFPLIIPSLAAGAIITFIFSLEDLGATIGFIGARANPLAKKVVSYQVFSSFAEALTGGISPKVAALAVIILILTVSSYILVQKYVNIRNYTMLSKGGRWGSRVSVPSKHRQSFIFVFLLLLIIIASMPQIGTILLATTDWTTSGALPTKITGEYLTTLWTNQDVTRAITNSLVYSLIAVVIMVIVGSSIAYVVAKRNIPGKGILDLLATIPVAVPGITLAVGYFLLFGQYFRGSVLDPLKDPALLLIIAYSIRRLPFMIRSVHAGLQQIDKSLEESSFNLGAGRTTTFVKIILPLVIGHLISGALLGFVYSMAEVSTSVTLGALREDREPITFFISRIIYGVAAVGSVSIGASMCMLLMAVEIAAMTISNYILKQKVSYLGV